MSDIGFYGLASALVGMGMLAIAGVGFLIEVLILKRRRQGRKPRRVVLLGPILYGLIAVWMLFVAEEATLAWKETLDDAAVPIAVAGLLPWIAVHLYLRRRKQADAEER
jgi:hypothetical protein